MRIGTAADHGGFELKVQLTADLKAAGYKGNERFRRRLAKMAKLERERTDQWV